jgi:hypothetical protein
MCRYSTIRYKPHLACFVCRRAFRRRLKADIEGQTLDMPARCPECGGLAADMGLDFAPPPRRDVRAWALLAELFEAGITFHCCGCSGPGYRPRDPAKLRAFLEATLAQYQAALRWWLAYAPRKTEGIEQRAQAVVAWRERVRTLEEALRGPRG